MVRDQFCVLPFDHVFRPRDDQRLCLNAGKLSRIYIRVIDHQPQHLRVLPGRIALSRKQLGYPVPDLDRDLDCRLHPARIQVCPIQDETSCPFRIPHGKDHGDVSAIRKAEQVRLLDLMLIHEPQEVISELPDGKRLFTPRRPAVSPGVERVHMIVRRKSVDLALEIAAVLPVPVEQNERFSLPLLYVKMLNVHLLLSPSHSLTPPPARSGNPPRQDPAPRPAAG